MLLLTVIMLENIRPDPGTTHEPLDLQSNVLPTELSRHVVLVYICPYDSGMVKMTL